MTPFDPEKPYNDLPLLPPRVNIETRAILKQCIAARSALAEVKTGGKLIPNQAVLINTLPLLEAKDSSEIENIVTTTDKLFQYASGGEHLSDPATKEALRYRTALSRGFQSLEKRPLSTATAVEICSTIKDAPMEIRKIPGTTLTNPATGEVIYTPPVGEAVLRDKLSNWEKFLHNETEIDPLVRMAVGHYQVEAIHPFTDGNGRTGRILNLLFLVQEKLLTTPILYLSRFIIQRKSDYYSRLIDVTRKEAWEPWILFMLEAVTETARWTTGKIAAVRKLMGQAVEHIKTKLPKIYSRELVEVIFSQPYCRISNLVDLKIAKRETASVYLKKLCSAGVLEERKAGREKLFIHSKFLQLITRDNNTLTPY
jgi:Fic family protein